MTHQIPHDGTTDGDAVSRGIGHRLREIALGFLGAADPVPEHGTLDVRIGPVRTIPQFDFTPPRFTMDLVLTDTQQVILGPVTGKDARGNASTVASPTFASGDGTIIAVTDNGDGTATASAVGPLGFAQVTVTDADATDSTDVLTAIINITVIGGKTVTLDVATGAPTEQAAPAAGGATARKS